MTGNYTGVDSKTYEALEALNKSTKYGSVNYQRKYQVEQRISNENGMYANPLDFVTISDGIAHNKSIELDNSIDVALEQLIKIALGQVGTEEKTRIIDGVARSNYTDYGDWYGLDGEPWCAMFASWCAMEAGISEDLIPKHASTKAGVKWYTEQGRYMTRDTDYKPRVGDLVYFCDQNGNVNHVGIVSAYDEATDTVYTIEGNSDNKVRVRDYSRTATRIHGYGVNGGTGYGTKSSDSSSGLNQSTI